MQLRELGEFCERRGWSVAEEYVDVGISGSKEDRAELNRLMADAHRRRFDAVVVWKFDRFARSVSHPLRALETFKALGIDFASLSEQVDTSTPTGKMVFTVLGAVAELERSLMAERVRAGIRNARAKGKRLGKAESRRGRFQNSGSTRPGVFLERDLPRDRPRQRDGPASLPQSGSDSSDLGFLILRQAFMNLRAGKSTLRRYRGSILAGGHFPGGRLHMCKLVPGICPSKACSPA
jgi:hypothetical protein